MENIKLTPKQKEIIKLMREGYPLMIGQSEFSGRQYYMIASTHNKGYDNTYFRADTFSHLLAKGLIQFNNETFDYLLTKLGQTIHI